MEEFLSYLNDWESSAESQNDLSIKDRRKLMLNSETIEGLRITGELQ